MQVGKSLVQSQSEDISELLYIAQIANKASIVKKWVIWLNLIYCSFLRLFRLKTDPAGYFLDWSFKLFFSKIANTHQSHSLKEI